MDVMNYIKPELLVLVPVLYLLGLMIKKTEYIKDKYIPIIICLVSIFLAILYVLATAELGGFRNIVIAIFTSITQGILCAGCAVFINQSYKQINKEE